jgi:uncharacterized repeat protein (TIGR01451 family)
MRKKTLLILVVSILAVSIPVTIALIHRGQPPSNGGTPEMPSNNATPETPVTPTTPSTLTMLSITEGNVFVMKAGTDTWIETQIGMSLVAGDTVKSGDNSSAEIAFFDGSTIELQAGTEIEVASLNISDTGSTTIKLKQAIGDTVSRVEKLVDSASRYEVETAACVAAVRGSRMIVKVITDGTTWVTNQEGEIWVIANGVERRVPEGRTCIIIPGWPPHLVPSGGGGGHGGGGGFSPNPDIAVTKISNPTQAHDEDLVTYTYVVTNPGNVPLSNVSVTDSNIEVVTYQSGDTNENGLLDTGETWIFSAYYTISNEDTTPLVNTAAAAGTYAGSQTIIAWDTASVDILRPAIALNKTAEPTQAHVGDNITYTYTISNAGNTPLYDILVTDEMVGTITYEDNYQSGDADEDEVLDVDETWIFTTIYTITEGEGDSLVNTASVSGTDALSLPVGSESSATVDILPTIAINKTAEPTQAHVGDNITYTYDVTNPGNVPLSNVSVTDDLISDIILQGGDTNENELLDTGETWVFTAIYTVIGEEPNELVNTATATGEDPSAQTVTAQVNATVNILRPAIALTLVPDPTELPYYNPNAVNITWTFNVTNTGNAPLSDVWVMGEMVGDTPEYQNGDTNGNSKLDTSETWTFIGYYTVEAGPFEGTGEWATAYGTDALGMGVYADAEAYVTVTNPLASIDIQIDAGPTASIFIWDENTNNWAVDEDTEQPVNGTNHTTPDTIAVIGGHYYGVWVDVEYASCVVSAWPVDWQVIPGYRELAYEAACGYAAAGNLYSVNFTALF